MTQCEKTDSLVQSVDRMLNEGKYADANLMGNLFDAIQSFEDELFHQILDRIKLESYTVLVRQVEPFSICYLFKGQSYSAQKNVLEFIQTVSRDLSVWNLMLNTTTTGQTMNPPANDSLELLLNDVFSVSS